MMRDNISVLTEVSEREITTAPSQGYNFILEGDNLHSLRLLEETHKGRIDVLYNDQLNSTGKIDFMYDDAYVDDHDSFKHSKWMLLKKLQVYISFPLLYNKPVFQGGAILGWRDFRSEQ